jgi:hypothetical protein
MVNCTTYRSPKYQEAAGAHLCSVLAHRVGLSLAQLAVDDKANEAKAIEILLSGRLQRHQKDAVRTALMNQQVALPRRPHVSHDAGIDAPGRDGPALEGLRCGVKPD